MLVHLVKEIDLIGDIYLLEKTRNEVILNNDYRGLIIYDSNFIDCRFLDVFDGIVIYHAYVNVNDDCMLLYCPDNNYFIFVDISRETYSVIDIPEYLRQETFLPLHYWDMPYIILRTQDHFYKMNVSIPSIVQLSMRQLETDCPIFYNFCISLKNKAIIHFDQYSAIAATMDQEERLFKIINLSTHKTKIVNYSNQVHDIIYTEDTIILIHEQFLKVMKTGKEHIINSEKYWAFLQARFLNQNTFVALRTNHNDPDKFKLVIYQISNT